MYEYSTVQYRTIHELMNTYIVLFIKFILNSVSVAYICIFNSTEWWLIMPSGADQCVQNTGWTTNDGWMDGWMESMDGWNGWMERMDV